MSQLELIESVGIEMEFSSIDRNDVNFLNELQRHLLEYRAIHDASCETPIDTFFGVPINFETDESRNILGRFTQSRIIGGEIVSPVINSNAPQWVEDVRALCALLIEHGEKENTLRDSFHVHVNISREAPLFVLKNLLHLTGHFEMHLYKLGGLGRLNRGEDSDYTFMRPYLGFGPPCVEQSLYTKEGKLRRRILPILNFKDLLAAERKTDFFYRYGNSTYHADRGDRYVTQRYMSVNFYPILTQGSIEFRTANKTLNPDYIIAWTNFCKAIVEKAFSTRKLSPFFKQYNPLHKNNEIPEEYFIESVKKLDALDPTTIDILLDIWNSSPTPHFDNVWRYTHLKQPTKFPKEGNYFPASVAKKNVKKPNHIDVHNLQRRNRPAKIGQNFAVNNNIMNFAGHPPPLNMEANVMGHEIVKLGHMDVGETFEYESNDGFWYFYFKIGNDEDEFGVNVDWTRYDEEGEDINSGIDSFPALNNFDVTTFIRNRE
jgi:hypothetical protein